MSGPAEDGCRGWPQQHRSTFPGASTFWLLQVVSAAPSQHESAVTYQLPAWCFSAAVSTREEGEYHPRCAASAEVWSACIQQLADDVERDAVHNHKICTCLL